MVNSEKHNWRWISSQVSTQFQKYARRRDWKSIDPVLGSICGTTVSPYIQYWLNRNWELGSRVHSPRSELIHNAIMLDCVDTVPIRGIHLSKNTRLRQRDSNPWHLSRECYPMGFSFRHLNSARVRSQFPILNSHLDISNWARSTYSSFDRHFCSSTLRIFSSRYLAPQVHA